MVVEVVVIVVVLVIVMMMIIMIMIIIVIIIIPNYKLISVKFVHFDMRHHSIRYYPT
jgi:hypothetical protein